MVRRRKTDKKNIILTVCVIFVFAAALVSAAYFVFPDLFFGELFDGDDYKNGESMISDFLEADEEIRGVYIATVSNINYPSSQGLSDTELISELDAIIDTCTDIGFNTVVFQVRPSSDSFYNSTVYPSSSYITGKQGTAPDIDILAELVERAHNKDIAVIAWVNPLRVTSSGTDTSVLAGNNPARMHPEFCIEYGGALYLDPALEGVRETVARGCAEIAANYDVDAILFDDYFYPYPKDGEEFDDSESYAQYGSDMDFGDWRRSNINSLVEKCYDAIKSANKYCLFGIAPFGIWSNNDGTNGGSDTRGLDAYNDIFCDALAWAEGGYIDFLAPQIYWSFDTEAAPYGHLADWWINALAETDVTLLTSNAGYRVSEWSDPDEIANQIEYNRECGYSGALIYGYAAVVSDENNVISCLSTAYADENDN